jgi:hypothetical protein
MKSGDGSCADLSINACLYIFVQEPKVMNRDKCPLRDTSQDGATRRRCISTREETRVSTLGLHNE